MSLQLAEAQSLRRQRGDDVVAAYVDRLLDHVGLSDAEILASRVHLGTADVSPAARKKLAPIINSLRKDPHPFTRCMKNLREEQPTWSEDRRKKTCSVLKSLAGRSGNSVKASVVTGPVVRLDAEVMSLLDMVDTEVLAIMEAQPAGEEFATISAKQRKKMPPGAFVFPKDKRYPIHDKAHAANALARASGKPEEAAVRRAVCKRHPDLPKCKEKQS